MAATQLAGKVALITGGNSGIGLGTAQRFAQEGAFVYITGRRQPELDKAVQAIGENCRAVQADVTSKADMQRVIDTIRAEKGTLDIVFANAGSGRAIDLAEVTDEYFTREFDVNVKGVLFTVQTALPLLKDGSSIILNGSVTADMGLPGFGIYAAAKAAVRSFARSWTTDFKSRQIRVNTISPGVVPTEGYQTEQGMSPQQVEDYAKRVSTDIPMGRVGTPDEIAKAVVFLASDASSYITGIDLTVDGGMTMVYAGES